MRKSDRARPGLGYEWAYRDQLIALLVVFMALAAFAMLTVTKKDAKAVTPGDLLFQLAWDPADAADVDLWVRAPGDQAVGFSHQAGRYCNLLRDDLGRPTDTESRNLELTVCRGLPDGEWIATVVLYAFRSGPLPVPVIVSASLANDVGTTVIVTRDVALAPEGDEETAFRFTLRDHKLVPGSINQLPMRLFLDASGRRVH